MLTEITCAVDLLCSFVQQRSKEQDLTGFRAHLVSALQEKYEDHWYPENSIKGSAYRAISNTPLRTDPLIVNAAQLCNVQLDDLLPKELTLWVDPHEVAYRIGADGSVCQLKMETQTSPSNFNASSSPSSSRSASPPVVLATSSESLQPQRTTPQFPRRARSSQSESATSTSNASVFPLRQSRNPYAQQQQQHSHAYAQRPQPNPYAFQYHLSAQSAPLPLPGQYSAGNVRFVPPFMQEMNPAMFGY